MGPVISTKQLWPFVYFRSFHNPKTNIVSLTTVQIKKDKFCAWDLNPSPPPPTLLTLI